MSRVSRDIPIQVQETAGIEADDARGATPAEAFGLPVKLASLGFFLVLTGVLFGIASAGDRVLPADQAILDAVQRPEWFGWDRLAWVASRVGDPVPALMIGSACAGVCVKRQRVDLAFAIVLAAALRALSPPLKDLFQSQRPPAELVSVLERADAFGYPSGHAFGAALVFGMVAIVIPRARPGSRFGRAIRVLTMLMVVLIPLARVRLGVHWPSDVVGGLAFGLGFDCLLLAGLLSVAARTVRR